MGARHSLYTVDWCSSSPCGVTVTPRERSGNQITWAPWPRAVQHNDCRAAFHRQSVWHAEENVISNIKAMHLKEIYTIRVSQPHGYILADRSKGAVPSRRNPSTRSFQGAVPSRRNPSTRSFQGAVPSRRNPSTRPF